MSDVIYSIRQGCIPLVIVIWCWNIFNTQAQQPEASITPQLRGGLPEASIAEQPIPIFTVVPIYPRASLLAGQSGSVTLKYKVNPEGRISKSLVVSSTDPIFSQAAQHALQYWRFKPLIVEQQRSTSVHRQTFSFRPNAASFYSLEALAPEKPVLVPFPTAGLRPAYPEALREEQITGHCDLIVTIDRNGGITDVNTENASHPLFAERSLLTAKKWSFLPQTVTRDGLKCRLTFLFRP